MSWMKSCMGLASVLFLGALLGTMAWADDEGPRDKDAPRDDRPRLERPGDEPRHPDEEWERERRHPDRAEERPERRPRRERPEREIHEGRMMGFPGMPGMGPMREGRGMGGGMMMPEQDEQMARLNRADMELEHHSRNLAMRYREASEEEEREEIREQLEKAVNEHFEVRQERRAIELERLEREINRLREVIERRNEARDRILGRRMNELLGVEDELRF